MVLNYMSGLDDGRIIYATYFESIEQCLLGKYIKYRCKPFILSSTLQNIIEDNSSYTGTYDSSLSDVPDNGLLAKYNLTSVYSNSNTTNLNVDIIFNLDALDTGGVVYVQVGYYDASVGGMFTALASTSTTTLGTNSFSFSNVGVSTATSDVYLRIFVITSDAATYPVVSATISNISVDLSVDDGSGIYVGIQNGNIVYNGQEYLISASSIPLDPPLLDKDRADVLVWDYNGGDPILKVITGTRWLTLADGTVIPITDRISDNQIPIAIIIVRAGATAIVSTDVIDVRSGLSFAAGGPLTVDGINPKSDATGNIGEATLRFLDGYFVNLYTGDIIFDNKYRFSEYDDNGELLNGIRMLDNSKNELLKVTQDGIWFKGNKIV